MSGGVESGGGGGVNLFDEQGLAYQAARLWLRLVAQGESYCIVMGPQGVYVESPRLKRLQKRARARWRRRAERVGCTMSLIVLSEVEPK